MEEVTEAVAAAAAATPEHLGSGAGGRVFVLQMQTRSFRLRVQMKLKREGVADCHEQMGVFSFRNYFKFKCHHTHTLAGGPARAAARDTNMAMLQLSPVPERTLHTRNGTAKRTILR
jgi:hypothetical protein